MEIPAYKLELLLLMEVCFSDILSEYQCIYNVSSRESESRNTRGKLVSEMALKLEKSNLNLYIGIRYCCEEKDVI